MIPVNAHPLSLEVRHQEHHYHRPRVPHVHRAHRVSKPVVCVSEAGDAELSAPLALSSFACLCTLCPRLCSIFEAGLVESLQSPDGSF